MTRGITLIKNNENKDWEDLEWINDFYLFLQGEYPGRLITNKLKLNKRQAFSVIYYLQEHLPVFPDHIEKCDKCGDLFDSQKEGHYSEKGNKIGHFFCEVCIDYAPKRDFK